MWVGVTLGMVGIVAVASGAARAEQTGSTLPFPHPVITEVLFAVPTGEDGDANRDGKRTATGDEFVELMNPHDRAIDLKGYVLTDRNEESNRQVKFVFPACRLAPGAVVVVFNGEGSKIPGPVGDEKQAPAGPNPDFGGALVFSMKVTTKNKAFSNTADYVLLTSPKGEPIDAVQWGNPTPAPPAKTLRVATVDEGAYGSVQRLSPAGELVDHGSFGEAFFSPGVIPAPDRARSAGDSGDGAGSDR